MAERDLRALEDRLGSALAMSALLDRDFPVLAGRYELRRLLGRGSYGLVVEARDKKLDRKVALKLFPVAEVQADQLREARAAAGLDHPNALRILDVDRGTLALAGEAFPCVFLSMEHVEGESLRAYAGASPRPAPEELLRAYLAAGEALGAAHEQGIVHGDIKPDNILLDARGRPRVADFGLALRPAREGSRGSGGLGTRAYLAPEALEGAATPASDQYAFAISLWEALAGVHPFEGRVAEEGEAPRGSPAAPEGARAALRRALAFRPGDRFPSMAALLEALRTGKTGESSSPPATPPPRSRWRLAFGGCAALSLLCCIFGLGWQVLSGSSGESSYSPPVEPEPREMRCASMPRSWAFESFVTWADERERSMINVVRGVYQLTLDPSDDCSTRGTLLRTGFNNNFGFNERGPSSDSVAITLRPRNRGVVAADASFTMRIVADATGYSYMFRFLFDSRELLGDYVAFDPHGQAQNAGLLFGREGTAPQPFFEDLARFYATQRRVPRDCDLRRTAQGDFRVQRRSSATGLRALGAGSVRPQGCGVQVRLMTQEHTQRLAGEHLGQGLFVLRTEGQGEPVGRWRMVSTPHAAALASEAETLLLSHE